MKIIVISNKMQPEAALVHGRFTFTVLERFPPPTEGGNGLDCQWILVHTGNSEALGNVTKYHLARQMIGITGAPSPAEASQTLTSGLEAWVDLGIPILHEVETRDDVLALDWDMIPPDFAGTGTELMELLSPETKQFLIALLIMCQGYLVGTALEARHKSLSLSSAVQCALKDMGWTSFDEAPVDEALREVLVFQADGILSIMKQALSWRDALGEVADLENGVRKEWSTTLAFEPAKDVLDLIGKLKDQSISDVDLVARAYGALAHRLRK